MLLLDGCKSDAERLAAHAESVSSAAGVRVGDLGDARSWSEAATVPPLAALLSMTLIIDGADVIVLSCEG
jgi:hypothetical protein